MQAAFPPALQARLDRLTGRERIFLGAGAGALLLFLIYLLLATGEESLGVELASTPAPPLQIEPPTPPLPAAITAPPVPAPSADGLVLSGVLASGAALISLPGGQQRFVRRGGQVVPGLTLREVALKHVVLSGSGGDIRLQFDKAPEPAGNPAAVAAVPGSDATQAPAQPARETTQFRLGLAPRRENGRTTGFTIRPDADVPSLKQAGMRPGDVLIAVNGAPLQTEERLLELAQEISTSWTAEFEFERGGRRMKTALEVKKRPDAPVR